MKSTRQTIIASQTISNLSLIKQANKNSLYVGITCHLWDAFRWPCMPTSTPHNVLCLERFRGILRTSGAVPDRVTGVNHFLDLHILLYVSFLGICVYDVSMMDIYYGLIPLSLAAFSLELRSYFSVAFSIDILRCYTRLWCFFFQTDFFFDRSDLYRVTRCSDRHPKLIRWYHIISTSNYVILSKMLIRFMHDWERSSLFIIGYFSIVGPSQFTV